MYRPLLEITNQANGRVHRAHVRNELINRLGLTETDLSDRSNSGSNRFRDRFSFASHDLKIAGLISYPQRGYQEISEEGRRFLQNHPGPITDRTLRALRTDDPRPDERNTHEATITNGNADTPHDLMDTGYRQLQDRLVLEIVENTASVSPDRFEQLVVDLLEKMGYGEGRTVGRSGDGGIDGIINQDALGLEKVYVQAKRYTAGAVGEPEIRNFSGSLDARGATKGVFITTSTFSNTARQTAQTISAGSKFIRLVDGNELAQLMIRHGVGVVTEYTYEIKKLDENYFAEDV